MILAAGFGTRLKPITDYIPKPLVPILNKPLIEYTIDLLARHKITDIYINLHYLMDSLATYLGDGKKYGVKITYSKEKEILGTGGGIKKCEKFLKDGPFLVINSDILLDIDLFDLIQKHEESGALATMVLRKHPESKKYGEFSVDENGLIVNFLGKGENISNHYMFTGVHLLEPEVFNYLETSRFSSIIDSFYRKAFDDGKALLGYIMEGYWSDVGTLDNYLQTSLEVLRSKYEIDKDYAAFSLNETVYIGENVKIKPPVYFGSHIKLLTDSIIGPDVILGNNTVIYSPEGIEESIILNETEYRANSAEKNIIACRESIEKLTIVS